MRAVQAFAIALCLAVPFAALAMMPKEASATLSSRIKSSCESAAEVQMMTWHFQECQGDEECSREAKKSFYEECKEHARECKSDGASSCTWHAPDVEWPIW